MFDINLLANPGTLEYDKINPSIEITGDDNHRVLKAPSIDTDFLKSNIKHRKSYLLTLVSIGLFCLIVGSILKPPFS